MNKQENKQVQQLLWDIYSGILFNTKNFAAGRNIDITYKFNCPEYAVLLSRYPIEKASGKGGDFERALRLCRWLYPRLKHESYYDNHVPCNSLALMEYSFEKPEHGINCLNKAKILTECCLALGIYARRVYMFPFSPYDLDNHVVTEIYDRKRRTWIMLDPSMGTYLADGEGTPLSLSEARKKTGNGENVTAVASRQSTRDMSALFEHNIAEGYNAYYAKNMAYFAVDIKNGFGDGTEQAYLLPENFNLKGKRLQTAKYRIRIIKEMGKDELLSMLEEAYNNILKESEETVISEKAFSSAPESRK